MDIGNTVLQLQRDPNLMAWRDRGVAIAVTPKGIILRIMIPRPYPWRPMLADIVAIDWQIGTQEQFIKKYAPQGELN